MQNKRVGKRLVQHGHAGVCDEGVDHVEICQILESCQRFQADVGHRCPVEIERRKALQFHQFRQAGVGYSGLVKIQLFQVLKLLDGLQVSIAELDRGEVKGRQVVERFEPLQTGP